MLLGTLQSAQNITDIKQMCRRKTKQECQPADISTTINDKTL